MIAFWKGPIIFWHALRCTVSLTNMKPCMPHQRICDALNTKEGSTLHNNKINNLIMKVVHCCPILINNNACSK